MIRPCSRADADHICRVINDGAEAYRGVIPADRWHVPYMSLSKLLQEMDRGVRFNGFYQDGTLLGVMGIEDVKEVSLIRHAYVGTAHQRQGVGAEFTARGLDQLRKQNTVSANFPFGNMPVLFTLFVIGEPVHYDVRCQTSLRI